MSDFLRILKRADVAPPPDLKLPSDEEINELLKTSAQDDVLATAEKLGYVPPSITAERLEREKKALALKEVRRRAQLPLAAILRQAGIKPFTPESVTAYKGKTLKGRFQIFNRRVTGNLESCLILPCFVINSAIALGIGEAIGSLLNVGHLLWPIALTPIISFVVGLFVCCTRQPSRGARQEKVEAVIEFLFLGSLYLVQHLFAPDRKWESLALANYGEDIPRPVLETVAEIHTRCPGACFEIEQLTEIPDPFLVVILSDERYQVEVWKEPNYNAERIA